MEEQKAFLQVTFQTSKYPNPIRIRKPNLNRFQPFLKRIFLFIHRVAVIGNANHITRCWCYYQAKCLILKIECETESPTRETESKLNRIPIKANPNRIESQSNGIESNRMPLKTNTNPNPNRITSNQFSPNPNRISV